MSPFLQPINVSRYLIGWRVNKSLVWLPRYPSVETTMVLGSIIASRLSSQDAGRWRKAIAPLETWFSKQRKGGQKKASRPPACAWPIEASLVFYPPKRAFGKDELILQELRMFGEAADHGYFLEVILPAMEEAGFTSDTRWRRRNRVWGSFDIDCIYVANGSTWKPLVQRGKLDLKYAPTATQWIEKLNPLHKNVSFRNLVWRTPADFRDFYERRDDSNEDAPNRATPENPSLTLLLTAFEERLCALATPRRRARLEIEEVLSKKQCNDFKKALEAAQATEVLKHTLRPVPKDGPGHVIGKQTFKHAIPREILFFLQIASILQPGRQTQYGCGSFFLS